MFVTLYTTRVSKLIQLSITHITGRSMLHTLTYGRNIGTTGYVSDLDWELYCQEVLDANFDGYTVQEMYQQEAVGLFTTATPMEFI